MIGPGVSLGEAELTAVARVEVLSGDRRIDWGTAFLIAPRHAITALHVVAREKGTPPEPRTGHLRLVFTRPAAGAGPVVVERRVHLVAEHASADADWALLELDAGEADLAGIDPLLLRAAELPFASPFQSFGFARTNPADGITLSGHVENARALAGGSAAIQLFSVQVAAAETRVAGQSGAPVFSDGAVVGLIRSFIERDGAAAAGTLYATPASAALADPFVRSIARTDPCVGVPPPPDEPPPAEPFRYLERYHRSEAGLLFGRCRELKAIARALESERRIVLIYGQSGVGKSSLVEAGIVPRLGRRYDVRTVRRTRERGLAGDLVDALGVSGAGPVELEAAWSRLEADAERAPADRARPVLVVLDQLEEAWTRPRVAPECGGAGPDGEIDELLAMVSSHHAVGSTATRLVLSFRKDWLPEVDAALRRWGLASASVRIGPLDFDAIEEIVLGIPRTPRLAEAYGLTVEPELARRIASDLTRDVGSAIAPALRVVLTNLWRDARARDREHPRFDLALYETLAARGLGLDRFLDERLADLPGEWRLPVEAGLALDLLEFHTTALATAEQRDEHELEDRYRERAPLARRLRAALVDVYLLVDAAEAGQAEHKTRLAHDMLAPVVRSRLAISQQPGPRARRLLEARADAQGGSELALDRQDLRIVERGLAGMRSLTAAEAALVARSSRSRRRGAIGRTLVTVALAGAVVAGLAGRALLVRTRSAAAAAEAAAVAADTARVRAERVAGCNCALVRIAGVPGLRILAISQVKDARRYDENGGAGKPTPVAVAFPRSKTAYTVAWISGEALLPPGDYVLEYSVHGRDARLMIHSRGAGTELTITPPIPEPHEAFEFVAGGDCGRPGAHVSAFFLAQLPERPGLRWADARLAALHRGGRLPSVDELLCASKLGLLQDADDEWIWTLEPSGLAGDAEYLVVSNRVALAGNSEALARVWLVRPVGATLGDIAITRRPLAARSVVRSAAGDSVTEESTRTDYLPQDIDELVLAISDRGAKSVMLRGERCAASMLRDELAGAGVPAASIEITALAPNTMANQAVVTASLLRSAPAEDLERSATSNDECRDRLIITTSSTVVQDDISFAPGTTAVPRSAEEVLRAVASVMLREPNLELVEVQNRVFDGPLHQRQVLSERRAQRIRDYLIAAGVAGSRLVATGYGDTQNGCFPDLAVLVKRHASIEELRAFPGWSPATETKFLLGELGAYCESAPADHTQVKFVILKRSPLDR